MAEVLCKNADRFIIGPVLGDKADLRFHGGKQQPSIAVFQGFLHLIAGCARPLEEKAPQDGKCLIIRRGYVKHKKTFLLSPAHGKHPVGWGGGNGLLPSVVVPVFDSLLLLAGDHL